MTLCAHTYGGGRHHLETEHGDMVAYPVVFLDAFRGWVRELPARDDTGSFLVEPVRA